MIPIKLLLLLLLFCLLGTLLQTVFHVSGGFWFLFCSLLSDLYQAKFIELSSNQRFKKICMAGVWEVYGRCIGGVWQVNGRCMGGVWKVNGRCMGGAWEVYGRCRILRSCVADLWLVCGKYVASVWQCVAGSCVPSVWLMWQVCGKYGKCVAGVESVLLVWQSLCELVWKVCGLPCKCVAGVKSVWLVWKVCD